MEIQVQGNFTTAIEVVSQIVMTPFSEAATGAALKKSVLKNFAKFTRKHLCRSLVIESETLTQVFFCFSVDLAKCLRMTCLQNTSGRLPLYFIEGRKRCFSLQAGKNKEDMILPCSYQECLYKIWFWNFLAQRKSSVKLVKNILNRFIIDIAFISSLISIRLTYQGLIILQFFCRAM